MRTPSVRFARYLQKWWDRQLRGGSYPEDWLQGRSVDALASEFRRDAQFEFAQASFLHRHPNAVAAREVVDQLLPTPTESDAEMLVEAVVRAGTTAQRVRVTSVAGALLTVLALTLRNVLRGR